MTEPDSVALSERSLALHFNAHVLICVRGVLGEPAQSCERGRDDADGDDYFG
jgi:hypothetical protein